MRPMTICTLGRQPHLALAELEALFGPGAVSLLSESTAAVDAPAQDVAGRSLGGAIKVAELIDELPLGSWDKIGRRFTTIAAKTMLSHLEEGKLNFGLSAIGFKVSSREVEKTGLILKKQLKAKGASVRYVQNKEPELSSATVFHNKLAQPDGNHYEWLLIAGPESVAIARTVHVQDIDDYSARDFGRPKRDTFVGMLPPKLAQMMIHLATGPTPPATMRLLDPFCGTGVVLQEAALMGYAVYGTDVSRKMIDYTRDNLVWLEDRFHIKPDKFFEVADATQHTWQPPIDIVVCEGYLGQPFSSEPPKEKLESVVYECNLIMKRFLENIAPQLTSGARLCVGLPAWHLADGIRHLSLLDDLENLGYNRIDFVHATHEELVYHRQDQVVGRELVVLTKE